MSINQLKRQLLVGVLFLSGALMSGGWVLAQEEAAEGEDPALTEMSKPRYIPLKPAFVVNYGGKGRLQYLKVDISVRVSHSPAEYSIRHHMPLIRNALVLLLSSQSDADISTQEGKELLRQDALERIQTILKEQDDQEGVVDLFFNNFVVQK